MIDSAVYNKDGLGIYSNNVLWKSSLNPYIITNMGECLNSVISGFPTIAHVRTATPVKGVKTINKESSHPFETDKLVLTHNGSLEFRKPEDHEEYKDEKVDSVIFMKVLDKLYDGTNFVPAIQETMKKFYGIYAFLIYSKLESKFYAIRGLTKKLNYSIVEITHSNKEVSKSIVINTDKNDLVFGLQKFQATIELAYNISAFSYSKVDELKEETIYEIDTENSELLEIGKLAEAVKPVAFFPVIIPKTNIINAGGKTNQANISIIETETSGKLISYLKSLNLTMLEFDAICNLVLKKGFFYCTGEEIEQLIETTYIPLGSMNNQAKKNIWNEIKDLFQDAMGPYAVQQSLRFPYMMNSDKKLKDALDKFLVTT